MIDSETIKTAAIVMGLSKSETQDLLECSRLKWAIKLGDDKIVPFCDEWLDEGMQQAYEQLGEDAAERIVGPRIAKMRKRLENF